MKHLHLFRAVSASAVIALVIISCGRQALPWYENTGQLWEDYMAAVEDAEVATAEEMDPDLVAIISPEESPQIEWLERDGRTFVLVGSVMTEEESRYWEDGQADMFLLDDRLPWVSLPYDLTARLKADARQTDSAGIVMRVVQMLGLPPDYCGNRIVLFWAEKDSLFRPRKSMTAKSFSTSATTWIPATAPGSRTTAGPPTIPTLHIPGPASATPTTGTAAHPRPSAPPSSSSAPPPASLSATSCPYPTGTGPSSADPPGFRGNRVFCHLEFRGNRVFSALRFRGNREFVYFCIGRHLYL